MVKKNIQEILRENNLVNSVNCQNDLSNSNVASWPYGPNATLNNAGLNANLKCRTGVSKNRVSPSNKIMIKPKSKRAFAANVYLNNAKTKKMRIL